MTKEHIIAEIQRTAIENNGICLGRDRFLQQTGIKESDWSGKYWVRWSDAVREAGLEPNQKTVAFNEEWLLEKYIALVRELGRIPVQAELRMKIRADPSFPHDTTFADRFGPKRELLTKVMEYCQKNPDFADVLLLCPEVTTDPISTNDGVADSPSELGYVYLMKVGRHYKIGRSNSVGRREYELAIQLPEKAKTVHTIRTDDPVGIEGYWHRRFAIKRKNGEWFELDSSDVKAFRRRTFM